MSDYAGRRTTLSFCHAKRCYEVPPLQRAEFSIQIALGYDSGGLPTYFARYGFIYLCLICSLFYSCIFYIFTKYIAKICITS